MDIAYSEFIAKEQPLDLVTTLESGQTFLWQRLDAPMFSGHTGSQPSYITARQRETGDPIVLRLTETDEGVQLDSNHPDARSYVEEILRLNDDIQAIQAVLANRDETGVMDDAIAACSGLRVVNEPLFPTLISFICSTNMRVQRIHEMVHALGAEYGPTIEFDGTEIAAFPTPAQLQAATEAELRDLKLGYRAPYVVKTVDAVCTENPPLTPLPEETSTARARLEEYTGVGTKVADCVLLYGDGRGDVVPVDTWIDDAVETYYPETKMSSRAATARALEDRLGEHAGYGQAYLFHYMRTQNDSE